MDMIILHLMLVMRQLRTGPNPSSPAGSFAQQLFDRFCEDMDDNFREMGVGDLAVPKEMRAVGEAFYGRVRAYEAALAADDDRALAAALSRNVFGGTANPDDPPLGAWWLATYMKDAAARLEVQAAAGALMDGRIDFPDPEVMPQEPSNEQAPT
jgi:cytochrome b pre-mRNA-processing protein 3